MCLSLFNMQRPRFEHPFTMIVAGPSQSGKSYFLTQLLKFRKRMFNPKIDKVIWFYGIYQSLYEKIPNVVFVEGLPENFQDYLSGNTLFIIDDLMQECGHDKRLTMLFTKGSHHLNLSVIFITQNLFYKGSQIRNMSLNSQYLILFKNRRDLSQVMHLGRQLYPRKSKYFQEVYEDTTRKPHSYLLIDLRNETPEDFRLRTQVLPGQIQYIYKPKSCKSKKIYKKTKHSLKNLVFLRMLTKQQLKDLQLIQTCPKALRKNLLKKLPIRSVKAVCECTLNVLKGNVPLSIQQKRSLGKHKTTLRKIASKKGSLNTKKKS